MLLVCSFQIKQGQAVMTPALRVVDMLFNDRSIIFQLDRMNCRNKYAKIIAGRLGRLFHQPERGAA